MNLDIHSNQTQQKFSKKLNTILTLLLLTTSVSLLVPFTASAKNGHVAPYLFDDFGIQQSTKKKWPAKAHKAKKNRSVNVRTDLLWADTLTLNLFDDVIVTAVRDRMVDNVKGNSTWIGHIEGEQDSEVFLTVRGKTMSGTVQIGPDLYEIEIKANNRHDITKVDPGKNPIHDDTKAVEDFIAAGGQVAESPTSTTDAVTSAASASTIIDLMVVYTPKAKTNASGQAGIETKIANAVAMANQAYINSNIDMQLNVVYTGEISYVETGDMPTSLNDFTGSNDGVMDEVHTLRNKYGADQVVLITADSNYCGIGYVMQNPGISFAPYAFSVVHDDSTYACLSNSTLAHELGHNQGDAHDRDNASVLGAYDYSYGYRLCVTGGFRDIMSYACTGGTRVNYFSNPNVKLTSGQATGTSTENNALSMTNTKAIVAAFRTTVGATAPIAPGNLKANTLSDTSISLVWSDNSSDETGFRLERSADGINWNEFAVTAANIVSYVDTGLAPSISYRYRARAYNSNGNSSYSNISTAATGSAGNTGNTGIDTTAPIVTILKPTGGAKVSGWVSISVKATDNVGLRSLNLSIDGKVVRSGKVSSLSYSWNTSKAKAGTHIISSQAIDLSNNVGSKSVTVSK